MGTTAPVALFTTSGAFPKVTCPFTATTSRIQARSVSTVRPFVMGALPDLVLRNHRPSSEEEVSLSGHRSLHAAIEPSRQTVRAFLGWQSDITLNPRAAIATSTDRFLLAGWFRRRLVRVVAPEETSPSQSQVQLAQSPIERPGASAVAPGRARVSLHATHSALGWSCARTRWHPMVGTWLVPCAVVGMFLLLRLLLKPAPLPNNLPSAQLEKEFRELDSKGAARALGYGLVATTLAWGVLFLSWQIVKPGSPDAVETLEPSGWLPLLPAMSLGGSGALIGAMTFYKRRLGRHIDAFVRFQDRAAGYRTRPVMVTLAAGTGLFGLTFGLLCLDWYVQFTKTEMRYQPLFGFALERHSYQDIERILTAPHVENPLGRVIASRRYVIVFSDGTSWTTNQDPSNHGFIRDRMAQFVSERSGVRIEEVPLLTRDQLK